MPQSSESALHEKHKYLYEIQLSRRAFLTLMCAAAFMVVNAKYREKMEPIQQFAAQLSIALDRCDSGRTIVSTEKDLSGEIIYTIITDMAQPAKIVRRNGYIEIYVKDERNDKSNEFSLLYAVRSGEVWQLDHVIERLRKIITIQQGSQRPA